MGPEPDPVPVGQLEHPAEQRRSVSLAPMGGVDDELGGDVAVLPGVVGRVQVGVADQHLAGPVGPAEVSSMSRAGGALPCLT